MCMMIPAYFYEKIGNNASIIPKVTPFKGINTDMLYIKDNKLRLYPMFTWITSKYINSKKEFRTGYNEQGRLGVNDPEKYLK